MAKPAVAPVHAERVGETNSKNSCRCGADHFVQFYDADEYLVSSLTDYAAKALAADGTVLLIGTPPHLTAVEGQLARSSHDVARLRAEGRLVVLDAAGTLEKFMVAGQPDPALFARHLGTVVERLAGNGRPLHAFGEMVALLWADGHDAAALALESLWNELRGRHQFKLFCAYPIQAFAASGSESRFLEVCASHGRVVPAESFLPAKESSESNSRSIALLQQKAAALAAEVAERRRAEETLRRREAQLTAFVETASIGMHWVNADGIIVWANPAELQLLGYRPDEYIGRHIAEFHADGPVIEKILACLSRNERLCDREARLRCKDGSIKTVLINSSVLWEDGRFVHTQCFTRDITEQRRAEMAAQRWATVAEASDDAIFSLDAENRVTSWNAGAERLFGYTRDEVLGQTTKIVPDAGQNEERAVLARIRRGERVGHYETLRQRKGGGLVEVSITVSALRDAAGGFAGVAKVARDISETKRAERALRQAREEIAVANAALEQQVADLRQLQELSWRVYGATDQRMIVDELLQAALAASGTDKGVLSLASSDGRGLTVAASSGFDAEFLRVIEFVAAGQGACGGCLLKRQRVVVEDVRTDPLLESYRAAAERAGFRAIHSTPLITRDGRLIGVLSVHFVESRRPTEREMQLLDLYARHAADLIENHRLRQELQRELMARTETAEALRITTERFELAAYGRTLTLFEQDTALRYVWLYPEHPEHAGALGRSDEDVLGPAGAPLAALKREVLETGLTRQAEVRAALPGGDRHYDLTVLPKRNSTGAIVGVAGAAFDITDRKQVQQALVAAQEETARMNRELEDRVAERTASLTDLLTQMESFSYAVSHDLRSPLRAMAGYATVLKSDHASHLTDEGRLLLDRIIRASERMGRLINDVLAYARINRDRLELVPVSLGDCLKHVVQYAPELQAPKADLIVRGELPTVRGTEAFVTQVLANLLGNAVKFVPPGRKPRIEISTEIREVRVRVCIADNGIGIKPEHRDRLFGLFERLNVDKRYEGTGMGLAIVRRAVERMAGSVSVESDGQNGSRFILDLPLARRD